MPFTDDKTPLCIPFILKHLEAHRRTTHHRPLIVGLNGLQGIGKTTLVNLLTAALKAQDVATLVCSIDDFYLTHDDQLSLALAHPQNALWQHRGEPGTHDIPLLESFLSSLLSRTPTLLPHYDKAAHSGQGDRLPVSRWTPVGSRSGSGGMNAPQVVILEGWCVGFRPLPPRRLIQRYAEPSRTLRNHSLASLSLVNDALREYDAVTDLFDAFIHVDAEDLAYVYDWRIEQEDDLRVLRGDPAAGMSRDQLVGFVDAYFPGYEMYVDGVRAGVLPHQRGCQLRLIVGRDRRVKKVVEF